MKFLIDNQLPQALRDLLTSFGCDCVHVLDVGLADRSDAEIWRRACETGMMVVSKDADFLYMAIAKPSRAGLIWVRLGNCRTAALLAEVKRYWPRIEAALAAGERIIEIR